jgi:hypothetical protein
MRFGVTTPARLAYTDRAASERGAALQFLAIAPHGATTRYSFTVSAGRRYIFEYGSLYVRRDTVAAPAAAAQAAITFTATNGQVWTAPIAFFLDNVVGVVSRDASGMQLFLKEGATIVGSDSDTSTGGTMSFIYGLKGTEYDA